MYENNKVKKNNEKKSFYSMKSGSYKRKSKFDRKIMLIIGLVFLTGMLITFLLRDDSKSLSAADNGNDISNVEQNDKNSNSQAIEGNDENGGLDEVPIGEGVGPLSAEEVKAVKAAIDADTEGYFRLVNKENFLNENYKPDNLIIPNVGLTKDRSNEQNLVRGDIADDVEAFLEAAKEAGFEIFLSSGYRGYNLQSIFYNNDLKAYGYESGYVAKQGTSEHQLGLAIDITSHSVNLELTDDFENTPEGKWALDNAYKYGFILRYKAEKEAITGYKYEPWHYRYIGDRTISKLCHDKDLTLEELLQYAEEAQ